MSNVIDFNKMTYKEYEAKFKEVINENSKGGELIRSIQYNFKEQINNTKCKDLLYCIHTDDNKLTDEQVAKFKLKDKEPNDYSFEIGDIVVVSKDLEPIFYEVDKVHDLMILTPSIFFDRDSELHYLGYPFILPNGKYVMGTLGTNRTYYDFDIVAVVFERFDVAEEYNIDTAIEVKRYMKQTTKLSLEFAATKEFQNMKEKLIAQV